jgi:RecA-family ATPase
MVAVWDNGDDAPLSLMATINAHLPPDRKMRAPGSSDAGEDDAPEVRYVCGDILPPSQSLARLPHGDAKPPHIEPHVVDPLELVDAPIPPRRWIVPNWLPVGYTTLCYGEAGTGKTMSGQQLLTACATIGNWLGLPVEKCRAFALYCEDDADDVHLRQAKINARMGIGFADLGNFLWSCPVGQDNTLIRFERNGTPILTDRFKWLRDMILGFGARIVMIDTVATTFGGNENDRGQVTAFVGQALTSLAQEMDGAVLLNAHPSRAGTASRSGDSGSTGWGGSARSRWYFEQPRDEDGTAGNPNARVLTRMKSNGSVRGEQINVTWCDWFFERTDAAGAVGGAFEQTNRTMEAEQVFLTLLDRCDEAGIPVSFTPHGGSYAPKVFFRRDDREGVTLREFERAMHGLITREVIWNTEYLTVHRNKRMRLARKPPSAEESEPSDQGE